MGTINFTPATTSKINFTPSLQTSELEKTPYWQQADNTNKSFLSGESVIAKSLPGQKETLFSAGAKTAANVLPDAWNMAVNLVKGIAKANPIAATKEAVSQIKKLPETVKNPLKTVATAAESAGNAMPPIFKNLVDGINAKVAGNEQEVDRQIELFKSNIIQHPVENIAPVILATDMWARAGGFKPEFDEMMTKVARPGTKAIEFAGKITKEIGKKAYNITTKMEEPTKIALRKYQASKPTLWERIKNVFSGEESEATRNKPITESETAARQGLIGTQSRIGVEAERAKQALWSEKVAPALKASDKMVNPNEFFNTIKDKIVASTPDLTKQNAWLDALQSIQEDYKASGNWNLTQLQDLKSSWSSTIPQRFWKGQDIAGNLNNVRGLMSGEARNIILKTLQGDIKTMYADYGNLKSIIEHTQRITNETLGTKSILKESYEALIEKVVTPVTTGAGWTLYKTGEGLEFLGKPGFKTVGQVLGLSKSKK